MKPFRKPRLLSVCAILSLLAVSGAVAQADGKQAAFAGPEVAWKGIVFGQSTNSSDDSVAVAGDGSVLISSLNGKGKVTGAHDGIAYYYAAFDPVAYNFVLSADIEVLTYANDGDPSKTKPNNQEGFGIMLRDAIGAVGDSGVFASNIVYAGGYRGQTQAVMREGVSDPSGSGAKMASRSLSSGFPGKGTRYSLSIRKSNTGYHLRLNDDPSTEAVFYRPKLLQVQDPDTLYAGFFAARNATIRVTNIRIVFSDPATDPAASAEPPLPVAVVPAVAMTSAADTPLAEYSLTLLPTVAGALSIQKAGVSLVEARPVAAGAAFTLKVALEPGENAFTLIFSPAQGQLLGSSEPVKELLKVTRRTIGSVESPIFASPSALSSGDGSREKPVDVATAVKYVLPGQTIRLLPGIYALAAPLVIARGNDGAEGAPKTLVSDGAEKAVFDFGGKAAGLQILGEHWRFRGIVVTKSSGTGIRVAGSHNVIEFCEAVANGNTGIQVSGSSAEPRSLWPCDNLVASCLSRDNVDAAEEDADGFAAKLCVGAGTVFRYCVSAHNCDDGWDLYTKRETGAIEPVLIESCVAYGNGVLSNGRATKGDGNGFKLGGEGIAVKNVARDCVAFANAASGFTCNSNPAAAVEGAVACDNGGANFSFILYNGAAPAFSLARLYSLRTSPGPKDELAAAIRADDLYLYDGKASRNKAGAVLESALFSSLSAPASVAIGVDGKPALSGYLELKRP